MRDNTTTKLDRGPTGVDDRIVNVESARSSVAAIDYHRTLDADRRPGRRPAHMAGLFLEGTFTASGYGARRHGLKFTAPMFDGRSHEALVRLSPMRTYARKSPFDLHGIAARISSGAAPTTENGKSDYTDFIGVNTHPFPFRNADDFAAFFHRMRSGALPSVIASGAFLLGTLGGNASIVGLWRAVRAALGAKRPLKGRTYWGIHTFFIDARHEELGKLRIPYRHRFRIRRTFRPKEQKSRRTILERYSALADEIDSGVRVDIDIYLELPWRFERLHPWDGVPRRIRSDLINPQADWRNSSWIHVGSVEVTSVADRRAIDGQPTDPKYDDLMFDPTRLAEGLCPSDDPLLIARAGIYAESQIRSVSGA